MLPDKCVHCGKNEIKVQKRGLCGTCYSLWFKHKKYAYFGEKIVKRADYTVPEIRALQREMAKKAPKPIDVIHHKMEKKHPGLFDALLNITKTGEGNITVLAKKYGITKQSVSELLNKYFY